MNTSGITERVVLGILISLVLLGAYPAPALGHFAITYYDNYNYATNAWDAWQSAATPLDAWDDKYLADGLSGNTVFTDHAFTSIASFDLRGGLVSKDGHATGGEDWNPLQSIGDNVSGQSPHHVFAAVFKGLIYLEEGDVLWVASDDDVYVFLDGDTAWGQEILSVPNIAFFGTDSMVVTAAQAGYHTMTVKYIERQDVHSGIEITLNGEHLQNAEVVEVVIDIKPGSYPNSINQGSNGLVPVAIFSSPEFDATQVDPTSVSLAGASVAVRGKGKSMAHEEDVNGDGLVDLVVQVETQDLDDLGVGGTVWLTGTTFSGEDIVGYDEVVIVPPDQ